MKIFYFLLRIIAFIVITNLTLEYCINRYTEDYLLVVAFIIEFGSFYLLFRKPIKTIIES